MRILALLFLFSVLFIPVFAEMQQSTDKGTLVVKITPEPEQPQVNGLTKLKIDFINPTTGAIQEHIDYTILVAKDGAAVFGPIPLTHTSIGSVTIPVEFKQSGQHQVIVEVEGILFQPIPKESATLSIMVGQGKQNEGGGCLVATATYGTELAPQVQKLREIRAGLLGTSAGTAFMDSFNKIYYSFSPQIADWERQSPVFKQAVKTAITPMLWTLGVLDFAELSSEYNVLWYGFGVILLNVGIYFVAPAVIIHKLRRL